MFEYDDIEKLEDGEFYPEARLTMSLGQVLRKGRVVDVRIIYDTWQVEISTEGNTAIKHVLPIGTPDLRCCERVMVEAEESDGEGEESEEEEEAYSTDGDTIEDDDDESDEEGQLSSEEEEGI
ncbi:hypothetical protein HXX76_014080 [Chlamydomonas incerta]|nr:hypothetical protein HXX76_014080 [Chlamydomonas incerta]|eukprot:KAG2424922.1 hypothetical protein HXX76_014080 [Chlamydomonas incerta]